MTKKAMYAVLAVFFTWSVLDFIMHRIILGESYQETAGMWRPAAEMHMGLIYLGTLIFATVFVAIYTLLFGEKGLLPGLKYGLLLGIGMGFSMGYGSYAVMPIPFSMAFTWFTGTVVESVAAGLIVGSMIKQ